MDTLLSQGDHKRNGQGFLIPISGAQEAIQRAMIPFIGAKGQLCAQSKVGQPPVFTGKSSRTANRRACLRICKGSVAGGRTGAGNGGPADRTVAGEHGTGNYAELSRGGQRRGRAVCGSASFLKKGEQDWSRRNRDF